MTKKFRKIFLDTNNLHNEDCNLNESLWQSTNTPSTLQSTNILGSDILSCNAQSDGQDISTSTQLSFSTQLIRTRRNYNTKLMSVLNI